IGGMFLTAATHGTDQLMVQRYLSAKSSRSAGWALALSGFVVCLQFALFLAIGLALACFYDQFPPEIAFNDADKDRVFAHFIVHHLPIGLVGLTLAAVFAAAMSTLSSSLNSSATALVNDFYLPLTNQQPTPAHQLWISRLATALFGVLQICIALASEKLGAAESTVAQVLRIAGLALGPVLGLYLLGAMTKRVGQRAALSGFACGIAILSYMEYVRYMELATPLYWPWYAGCGALAVFGFGLLISLFGVDSRGAGKKPADQPLHS
ncbi:MAG: sodium:solute symporter family transporter, partial [Aeoliella sp.]